MSKKNKNQIRDQEPNKNNPEQQPTASSEQAKGRSAKDDYKSRY